MSQVMEKVAYIRSRIINKKRIAKEEGMSMQDKEIKNIVERVLNSENCTLSASVQDELVKLSEQIELKERREKTGKEGFNKIQLGDTVFYTNDNGAVAWQNKMAADSVTKWDLER